MPKKKNYITEVAMPAIDSAYTNMMTTMLEEIIKNMEDPRSREIFQKKLDEVKRGHSKET